MLQSRDSEPKKALHIAAHTSACVALTLIPATFDLRCKNRCTRATLMTSELYKCTVKNNAADDVAVAATYCSAVDYSAM